MRQLRENYLCIIKTLRKEQKRRKDLLKESYVKEYDDFHAIRNATIIKIKINFVLIKSAIYISINDMSST